ncbi:MAG TPA: dephospho-CoA kinase [Rhodocyclaceae bacterium]
MTSFVVGLTGGIGSGKSAAAEIFGELGAAVVDTDAIAHEMTAPGGAAMPAIRAAFGDAVIAADGSLNRPAMRVLAFSDAAARARLEAILHPMIRAESIRRCAAAPHPYAVLVVPLLVEAGDAYREILGRIVTVDCPEEAQIARVTARSGLPRDEVMKILAAQSTRVARLAAADDVIDNGGDLAGLRRQVESLHGRYLGLATMSSES